MKASHIMIDGNEAAAKIAHKLSEVIAIYPITPSTTMGELSDQWSAEGRKNLWGSVPVVEELQSEAGAAGAVHGALQTGALTTTFTASQGLLLMIPNMFKIAGERTPTVFHVAARTVATQGLSIFGDHSDVMATRATGFALLSSNSVQEAQDLAAIAHAATLESRVPFVHFFDGFRTSHEISKVEEVSDEVLRALIDAESIQGHRQRALSPEHPVIRGTAQNPDVHFQARETVNRYYDACPDITQKVMDRFAKLTGRQYRLYEYVGSPDAERVVVVMGSGAETTEETVKYLAGKGEKVGVLKVRLFLPFSVKHFVQALPASVKDIAVLDRTKEPGAAGEPMYLAVVTAIAEGTSQGKAPFKQTPRVIGGRYGLSSKEFSPAMAKTVFDEMLKDQPKNHFTVGIVDDVTHTSLDYDPTFSVESDDTVRCVFWGLGADGTVGANKNSIKIIGEETDNFAQGYFVYDSKKSGSVTVSHLRFGPRPIRAPYLVEQANFVGCHQFTLLPRYDVLRYSAPGSVFLLNSIYGPDEVWEHIPQEAQKIILERKLRFYVIDAYEVAKLTGMGLRINTIMQTCFFAISGVLPREQAIEEIKRSIKKTYGKRGEAVVRKNFEAVDQTLERLYEVDLSGKQVLASAGHRRQPMTDDAPEFVRDVLGPMSINEGDSLPVSALPDDGTYPSGTTRFEKRNIALEMPIWDPDICIQCGRCSLVCPHAVIRMKIVSPESLEGAPESFKSMDAKFFREFPGMKFVLQASPEDCTGCEVCVEICPAKDKKQVGHKAINMEPQPPILEREKANWEFFDQLPEVDRTKIEIGTIKNSQLLQPLFEFSGACTGCGETPYVKLLSQLFGDRMLVANATGCSSIYGGNLPTTPWTKNQAGRGPAWANSLFEDNAEFGLGFRFSLDKQAEYARELLPSYASIVGDSLVDAILNADQSNDAGIIAQRDRVEAMKKQLANLRDTNYPDASGLVSVADALVKKSVWILGGDGWAYDIGYGGLDHVLASGRNVNVLVLDTEVYSNTGGQASKATPRAAVAKFAAQGKARGKKDLGLISMTYGTIYVAGVAMGADPQHTIRAMLEADAYDGPSIVIAYSTCIAQGIDMKKGMDQEKLAVASGYWPLYRFNPALSAAGKSPFTLDSKEPSIPLAQYAYNETRYRMLLQSDEKRAEMLMREAQADVNRRWNIYRQLNTLFQPAAEAPEREQH